MKLSYGFLCDYCGCNMEYTEKTSVVYEQYSKVPNYEKVKSFNAVSVISLDLCPDCSKKAHKMLERRRKIKPNEDSYLKVCSKHMAKMETKERMERK